MAEQIPKQGKEGLLEVQRAVYDLVEKFKAEFGATSCRELIGIDTTDEKQLEGFRAKGLFEKSVLNLRPRRLEGRLRSGVMALNDGR